MDRRESLQWMLAAAALPALAGGAAARSTKAGVIGYGTDPKLTAPTRSAPWPLTMNPRQRRAATALCAVIIPADDRSPGAAELQVPLFIDEWISAPYPAHRKDRMLVVKGLAWIDAESQSRFGRVFAAADEAQQHAICDDICFEPKAAPPFAEAARFFARFRDLAAGGFYTTPQGAQDLQFVGNVALARFDGPPAEVIRIVGVQ